MIPCTAPDVRAIMPTNTEIQAKQSAKAIEIPRRREHCRASWSRPGSP